MILTMPLTRLLIFLIDELDTSHVLPQEFFITLSLCFKVEKKEPE